MKCCVKSCAIHSGSEIKKQGISCHNVPADPILKAKWIKNIRLLRKETDWMPSKHTRICSKHFKDQDRIPPKKENGHYQLTKDAVPVVPVDIDETESSNASVNSEMDDLEVLTDEEIQEILEPHREYKLRRKIKRLQHRLLIATRLACADKNKTQLPADSTSNEPTDTEQNERIDLGQDAGGSRTTTVNPSKSLPTYDDVPGFDDAGDEEYLETDELANDEDDIDDRCPSPEVVEKKPRKALPVLCGKCTRFIEDHLFVCASCSDSGYEPLCATCAEHQDAHATCYVLRANVNRPKTEILGVLCAIRSELAMKSFADELDDGEHEIKSEVDVPEDAHVLDVDPLDDVASAVALHEAPGASAVFHNEGDTSECESTVASELTSNAEVVGSVDRELPSPGIVETEDETDNEGVKSPQPTSMKLIKKSYNEDERQSASKPATLTTTLKTSNIVKVITCKDSEPKLQVSPLTPRDTPLTASIRTDNTQIIKAKAGPSRLKRCQDDNQHSDIKKAKLNIPQGATQLINVPKGAFMLPQGVKMLPKGARVLPKGAQLLPKGAQLLPKGAQLLPKGARLLPKGLKMLPKGAQMLPPGAKVTPKGFILTQKGMMLQDDYEKLPETVKIVLKGVPVPVKSIVRSENAPKQPRTVADDADHNVTVPSGSGIDPEKPKELQVVLKDLNLPHNLKTVKIITKKKPN